ncbi:unnamed protein product [Didymodactylos carnosus]|uniref:Single cache domain-containing protein n=1 Tax=Didymodactylos carnosus TaxID=1234261 RepID=A0A814LIF4_9BILA|nr:unnamed protein product [Didymodactylos carnosus]CAF1346176.1 unnamed protein product [Didymodactylos carnosus]CAF3832552.1 unnamed protein product [Didymodactylos carnosus]CAF4157161.1 unnamed protein product [Didymodactylos carnosus]
MNIYGFIILVHVMTTDVNHVTAATISNAAGIKILTNYLNNFKHAVAALDKNVYPGITMSYLIETDKNSTYIIGLDSNSVNPPGRIAYLADVETAVDQDKVYQGKTTLANGVTRFTIAVPIVQQNKRRAIFSSSLQVPANVNVLQATMLACGKTMRFVYRFYTLLKNTTGNSLTFYVYSSETGAYVRALTTIPDTKGTLAVGTTLTNLNVLNVINKNKTFTGTVKLYGRSYQAMYKPTKYYGQRIVVASLQKI